MTEITSKKYLVKMYCKMILTSFMGHWQGIPYFLNSGGHFILESKAQASSYVHEPT